MPEQIAAWHGHICEDFKASVEAIRRMAGTTECRQFSTIYPLVN